MTRRNAARWIDDEDFTSEHDEIFSNLLDYWPRAIPLDLGRPLAHLRIRGEPSLDGYPPTFPDAIAEGSCTVDNGRDRAFERRFTVVFEIKPRIASLGSVMRQLNLYRARAAADCVVLVTADHRFDRHFHTQGYHIVDPAVLGPCREAMTDHQREVILNFTGLGRPLPVGMLRASAAAASAVAEALKGPVSHAGAEELIRWLQRDLRLERGKREAGDDASEQPAVVS